MEAEDKFIEGETDAQPQCTTTNAGSTGQKRKRPASKCIFLACIPVPRLWSCTYTVDKENQNPAKRKKL